MKIGYAWVNGKEQNSKERIQKMKNAGVEKIIMEVLFKENEPLSLLMNSLQNMTEGDVLVVESLDELGESLEDIVIALKEIEQRNVGLEILSGPLSAFKTEDPETNRLLLKQLSAVLVWVENKKTLDIDRRQAKAVELLKATKKKRGSGRPKKYSAFAENPEDRETYFQTVAMLKEDIPIKRIADTLNMSRHTVYAIKEEIEEQNPH